MVCPDKLVQFKPVFICLRTRVEIPNCSEMVVQLSFAVAV